MYWEFRIQDFYKYVRLKIYALSFNKFPKCTGIKMAKTK
jgi:hypothetical protein